MLLRSIFQWTGAVVLIFAAWPSLGQERSFSVAGKQYRFKIEQDLVFVNTSQDVAKLGSDNSGSERALREKLLRNNAIERGMQAIAVQARHAKVESTEIYNDRLKTALDRPHTDIIISSPNLKGVLVPRIEGLTGDQLLAVSHEIPEGVKQVYRVDVESKAIEGGQRVFHIVAEDSVSLQFKEHPGEELLTAIARDYQLAKGEVQSYLKNTYTFKLTAPRGDPLADPITVHNRIQQKYREFIKWVEPDFFFDVALAADPFVAKQWGIGPPPAGLDLDNTWQKAGTRGSRDIRIAVIDTGIDIDHAEFIPSPFVESFNALAADAALPAEKADPRPREVENHGTFTVGMIAANPNNNVGIAGIAPDCSIIPIRAYTTGTTAAAVAKALRHAKDKRANVINISAWWPDELPFQKAKETLAEITSEDKCLVIAAAGNDGSDVLFPANFKNCMAVGSVDKNNVRVATSNYTANNFVISVMAPSCAGLLGFPPSDIVTTDVSGPRGLNPGGPAGDEPTGDYCFRFCGTSAAAPQVSALAGLIWSINPSLKASGVRQIIEQTADKVQMNMVQYQNGRNDEYGFGKVNMVSAVTKAKATVAAQPGGTGAKKTDPIDRTSKRQVASQPRSNELPATSGKGSEPTRPPASAGAANLSPDRDGPAVQSSKSKAEVRALDENSFTLGSGGGLTQRYNVDPLWVSLVMDESMDISLERVATIFRPEKYQSIRRSKPVVIAEGKKVYMVPREALLPPEELSKSLQKIQDVVTLQPVLNSKSGRLLPMGTLTLEVHSPDQKEAAYKTLSDNGLRVKNESGAKIEVELGEGSRCMSILDASALLSKDSAFRSVEPAIATPVGLPR
jgi:hypothetical protein